MNMKSIALSLATITVAFNVFAANAKKMGAQTADATMMNLDIAQSKVRWTGGKVTGSTHTGHIGVKSGSVQLKNNMITSGQFELDMNSMTNEDLKGSPEDMNKLVSHLKSDDFFNVPAHPTSTFKITSVKPVAGKPNTFDIGGELTIKGKTEKVQFPAEIKMGQGDATATAQLEIDRTKWGLKYGSGKFFKGLGDKVINDGIKFELNLVAKQ
jgi:polyisoprenoid-binding protein YceI